MKVIDWFWNCNSLLIYASFLVIVTWPFHTWSFFPFMVILYNQYEKFIFFQIHSLKMRRDNRMAAVMLQAIPTFFAEYSEKCLFISSNTYKKFMLCNDYCVSFHNDKTCFVSNCEFHIILPGNVEELLKKFDKFCFTYQHVDCLYTLFNYRLSGKVIAKSGQVFDNLQRAVDFNYRNKGEDRMPSIQKKDTLAEKIQKAFIQLLPKDQIEANWWISVCRKNWKSQKD